MRYFKKLRVVTQEGDIVYMDNAAVNQDLTYRSVEAFFAKKKAIVRYLPPNSTHLCSPSLWTKCHLLPSAASGLPKKGKTVRQPRQQFVVVSGGVSLRVVRAGIKTAGF